MCVNFDWSVKKECIVQFRTLSIFERSNGTEVEDNAERKTEMVRICKRNYFIYLDSVKAGLFLTYDEHFHTRNSKNDSEEGKFKTWRSIKF